MEEITSGTLLTEEQLKNNFRVFAGPGAGKTHFLTENIKNIIIHNPRINNYGSKMVACITYTNAAANEIKKRLESISDKAYINTIHGFIYDFIIKPFNHLLVKTMNEKYDTKLPISHSFVAQIEGQNILHGIEKDLNYHYIASEKELNYSKKEMCSIEFDINGSLVKPDKITENDAVAIKKYIWKETKTLSHTDILYFGLQLSLRYPIICYYLRSLFPFLFLDEFQDTSPFQTKIIQKLSSKDITIGVIGDRGQSIYSFQGARFEDFSNLTLDGGEISNYVINDNRRSNQNLVNFFNLVRNDKDVIQRSVSKKQNSNLNEIDEEKTLVVINYNSDNGKAYIDNLLEKQTIVLTRTWGMAFDFVKDIEDEQKKTLKSLYNSYYQSPIDLRNDIITFNNLSWPNVAKLFFNLENGLKLNSLNVVFDAFRSIDKECINELSKFVSSKDGLTVLKFFIKDITSQIKDDAYMDDLVSSYDSILNKPEYIPLKKCLGYSSLIEQYYSGFDKTDQYLKKIKYVTMKKLIVDVFSTDSKFMTIHQAKGQEWEEIIVNLQISKNMDKDYKIEYLFSNDKSVDSSETHRIFYVAFTRAKNILNICAQDNSQTKYISEYLATNNIKFTLIE